MMLGAKFRVTLFSIRIHSNELLYYSLRVEQYLLPVDERFITGVEVIIWVTLCG